MANIYKRGQRWWGRVQRNGRDYRESLKTTSQSIARQRLIEWLDRLDDPDCSKEARKTYREVAGDTARWFADMPGHPVVNKITGYNRSNITLAEGLVYFVSDGRAVKIGWALDGKERVKILQIGNSGTLNLLGTIKGSRGLERGLHKHFKRNRLRGEWFKPTKRFVEVITSIIEFENAAERER